MKELTLQELEHVCGGTANIAGPDNPPPKGKISLMLMDIAGPDNPPPPPK